MAAWPEKDEKTHRKANVSTILRRYSCLSDPGLEIHTLKSISDTRNSI